MKIRLFIVMAVPSILSSLVLLFWIESLEYLYYLGVLIFILVIFVFVYSWHLDREKSMIANRLETFPKSGSVDPIHSLRLFKDLDTNLLAFLKKHKGKLEHFQIRNELFTSLLNAFRDGVFCVNSEGLVVFQNSIVSNDLLTADSTGRIYYQVIKNAELLEYVDKIIENKTDINKQIDIQAARSYYSVSYSPIHIHNISRLKLFVISDKTRHQKLQKERQKFLQNASHELKTPVTSIRGYAETLLQRSQDSISSRFLDSMLRNTIRMERIIEDMVTISSIESGGFPFSPERIKMKIFFDTILILVAGMIEKKSQFLRFKIKKGSITTLQADPLLLEHLLLNLITNASSYSNENTIIEVHYSAFRGQKPLLEVIDQGSGIGPEYRKKIFSRFYRIDTNRSRQAGGSGLGLSIVRNIVQLHRGRIWVDESDSGGSIFRIEFPKL